MKHERRSYVPLLIRVSVYILAIIVLFLMRGRLDLKRFFRQAGPAAETGLIISGADLAPSLVDRLVEHYRADYPQLTIQVRGGGSAAALEDLINLRAGAVFLSRPPSPEEQKLFVGAYGDTAIWYPVALGAILVMAGPQGADSTVTLDALRALADGRPGGGLERLYVPDPNSGLWDVLRAKLGLGRSTATAVPGVVFLKDDATVARAVAADPRSLGVASSFALQGQPAARGVRTLSLRTGPSGPSVAPDVDQTLSGAYPLWSYLYAGCRKTGGVQGTMFVTHLTSQRGQRQIARTEFLPVQMPQREIHLNRRSPG